MSSNYILHNVKIYIFFISIDIIQIFVLFVLHLCDLIYFKIIFCEFCDTMKYLRLVRSYRCIAARECVCLLVTKYCTLYVHMYAVYINMLNCFVSCNLYVAIEIESTCVYAQICYRRSSQNCLHFDFISWCSFISYCMYFMMCKYWESLDKLPVFYLQNQLPQFL